MNTASLFQVDRTLERIALVSRVDFVQPLTPDQRRVLDLLGRHMGYARAINIREIGSRLNMTAREIKEHVMDLRKAPFCLPICASRNAEHGGYFLAETDTERRHAGEALANQAVSMLQSARNLLSAHELETILRRAEGEHRVSH